MNELQRLFTNKWVRLTLACLNVILATGLATAASGANVTGFAEGATAAYAIIAWGILVVWGLVALGRAMEASGM